MASYGKTPVSNDEDEDLEALRLAALKTLGSKPPSVVTNITEQSVVRPTGPGRRFRGGMGRVQSGRNQVFQRHRQNANLIAIVPVSNEPSSGINSTQNFKAGRGQVDSGIKLELPQDRYCKVESSNDKKTDTPVVSTKFSRYDDSNSVSSAEESEGEDSSDNVSASGAEEDSDVLSVGEDSLDKLMDELEETINETDKKVPESTSAKPKSEQKRTKTSVSKSKHNTLDSKSHKSQGGVSTSKTIPGSSNCVDRNAKESCNSSVDCGNDLSKSQSLFPTSVSYPSKPKDILTDRDVPQNSNSSPKTDTHFQRQMSPILDRKSRSGSWIRTQSRSRSPHNNIAPSKKIRRSRSPSPRGRFAYSPLSNQISRSPRDRLSRSPVLRGRLPRSSPPLRNRLSRSPLPRSRMSRSPVRLIRSRSRTRSRSPVRPLRSPPRKRYSRSPSWHSSTNNHLSRFSPQRSPRSRRPLSPKRSLSPRISRPSPQRSPQSRWWPSPRRSITPRLRRSPSPPPRHLSPRPRRISVSPRRQLSPIRRRMSPSPVRRNAASPLRRFSPRRNLSPIRYTRSVSRSPERYVPRVSSPTNRNLPRGSPHSPKRRASRSPARRRSSHSPFNRLPARYSPVNRKLSSWTPPKQNVNQRRSPVSKRYSNSPKSRRSQSPFVRQKRRSESPLRRGLGNRPPRSQRSPPRDGRRPLQEPNRVNNVNPRARSPLPSRQQPDSTIRLSKNLKHARKNHSSGSSISLSPSPDGDPMNNTHRYKSPLRLHASEFRNTVPNPHAYEESSNSSRHKIASPVQTEKDGSVASLKQSRSKPSKRKESRNKAHKRTRSKEDVKRESDKKYKEKTSSERVPSQESSSPNNDSQSTITDPKLAVLEARRRKFESKGTVKPEAKKIRLKTTQPSQSSPTPPSVSKEKQDFKLDTELLSKEHIDILKEDETTMAATEKSTSTLDNLDTLDDLEFDFDEPILELESGDLWSSEDSNSDNEGRFKSNSRIQESGGAKVTVLPFSKLLGEPKMPSKHNKSDSKKSTSEVISSKPKKSVSKSKDEVKPSDEKKKTKELPAEEIQDRVKVESKINNPSSLVDEVEPSVEYSVEQNDDIEEELKVRSREGDLRAELSRRRAERLTKAGSLHESLPARLLQNAFEGVVGKKNIKRVESEEKKSVTKLTETKKDKIDGRRVLVLKRSAVAEPRIPSISVTIPKANKRNMDPSSPAAKLPIRMRLGLPSGGSSPEEHVMSRRRNRKVKLKRNVMIGSRPDNKV